MRILFPGPEQVIRKQLTNWKLASFSGNEGPLASYRTPEAHHLCTATWTITVEVPDAPQPTLSGREELLRTARASDPSWFVEG